MRCHAPRRSRRAPRVIPASAPPGRRPPSYAARCASTAEELRLGAALLRLARPRDVPARPSPGLAERLTVATAGRSGLALPALRHLRGGGAARLRARRPGAAWCCAARRCATPRSCGCWPSSASSAACCWCCSPTASTRSTARGTRCGRSSTSYLPLLRPVADRLGIDLESAGPVRLIEKALNAQHSTLLMVAARRAGVRRPGARRGGRALDDEALGRVRRGRRHRRSSSRWRSTRSSRPSPGCGSSRSR